MKDIKNDPAFMEGMEAFLIGDWAVAMVSFLQLEKNFPDDSHITNVLGDINYSIGDLKQSIEYHKKTTRLRENCSFAHFKMGVSYFKMGKFNEALKELKLSAEVNGSENALVYYYLGLISTHVGQDEEAIKYFEKLREESPQTKMALFLEAQLQVKRHVFEPAVELLCEFLEDSPEFAEAHYLLGVAYMGMHRNVEALRSFRKALELNPTDKRSELEVDRLTDTDWY